MRARNHRTGAEIESVWTLVYGTTGLKEDGFRRSSDGRIEHEPDDSGTKIDWDSQKTATQEGETVYVDANQEDVLESDVEVFDEPPTDGHA